MRLEEQRRARSLLVLSAATNFISYCDRVCIALAAPYLRAEFELSPAQMGMIFGAFSLAYALFLTPWGVLADRSPPRRLIAAIVMCWSGFPAATAGAWNFTSMLIIRFLFGTAESGLNPAVAAVPARTVGAARRATAFGIFLGGCRLGGTLAPPLAGWLVMRFGWRAMFLAFAALGLVMPALWLRARAPDSAIDGASHAGKVEWRKVIRSRPLFLLMGVVFAYTMMWQFYPTWFPTYLIEKRHFTLTESSWYAGLPFLFGLAATWGGGLLTDFLAARIGVRSGRMVLGGGSLVVSALLLVAGMLCPGREGAAVLIALAAGAGDMLLSVSWATAVEIGGEAAGTVSGLMNAASNTGASLSPVLMGWAVSAFHEWSFILVLAAVANGVAAWLWVMLYV